MNLFIRKIIYKIILKVSSILAKLLTMKRWGRLTALLLRLNIRCLQNPKNLSDSIYLLILPKSGFTEDVMTAFGNQPKFCINALDRILIKAIFLAFLPKEIDDNNYVSNNPSIVERKKELRNYWISTLSHLKRIVRIDIILTGNYSYAAEQELAAACIHLEIPFVAIHKECLKTPGLEDFYRKKYETRKSPFLGTEICVYNDIEKNIQEKAKVASKEKIIVTGMPRLDRIHEYRKINSLKNSYIDENQKMVLFFSFNEKTGLPFIGRKTEFHQETLEDELERLSWENLAKNTHLAMLKLAQFEPKLKIVLKTKGDKTAKRVIKKYFGERIELPQNIHIISGGDPLKLIAESNVVCGFNSTALIEAATMAKPIVIPRFDEAMMKTQFPYILDFGQIVQYAYSPDELIDIILKICADPNKLGSQMTLDDPTKQIIQKWSGNADGMAGYRIRAVIEQIVNNSRKTMTI